VSQVPELLNQGTLLLNLTTLADIMLGKVDTWDHPAIRQLNPTLVALLPHQNVTVVLSTSMSSVTSILVQTLGNISKPFADALVGGIFPVESTGRVLWADDVAATLDGNSYTLGVWPQVPIIERRYIGFADFTNGGGERLSASARTIASALSDYLDRPFTSVIINGSCLTSPPSGVVSRISR
jgi:hypothetical protein